MKNRSPNSTPGNLRVFIACLLSFAMWITPMAAIGRGSSPTAREGVLSENSSKANSDKTNGADLFVNPPAAVGITATKTDFYTGHPNPAAPGDTITYTVDVANPNPPGNDATGVTFTDIIDANTTRFGADFDLKVSPLAINDTYSATKGVTLNVIAPGVLANDSGVPAPTANVIAAGPTTAGGTVTLAAGPGRFSQCAVPAGRPTDRHFPLPDHRRSTAVVSKQS